MNYDGLGNIKVSVNGLVISLANLKFSIATGTDNYTVTTTPVSTAYSIGDPYLIQFTNANTGASTLDVDTLGPIDLYKQVSVPLVAGDILANQIFLVIYDGANFQMIGLGGSSGLSLETDGTPNGIQTLLNLAAGTNITLTDNGLGTVTIDAVVPSNVPPVDGSYADQAAMIADQGNQLAQYIYFDGTDYWEYLGTVVGNITDYRQFSSSLVAGTCVSIYAIRSDFPLFIGDGKSYFSVTSNLNGLDLSAVEATVFTPSTSGLPEIRISRGRQSAPNVAHTYVSMLSTNITIDADEYDSKDATTPPVIDTSNDDVLEGDIIRVDVIAEGTGTLGLLVRLTFA